MKSQSPEIMRGQAYQAHGGLCCQVREAQDFRSLTPRHAKRQDSIPVWGLLKARSTHCTQSRGPEMQTIEVKPLASCVGKTRWRKAAQLAVTTGSPVVASKDAKHSQAECCCCNPQQHPLRIKHAVTGTLPTPTPHTVLPASAFHPVWSSAAAGVRTSCCRLVHPHCAPVRATQDKPSPAHDVAGAASQTRHSLHSQRLKQHSSVTTRRRLLCPRK
jgi:hypothetical protein